MSPSFGATLTPFGIEFRVWAPAAQDVTLDVFTPRAMRIPMKRDGEVFSAAVEGLSAGARYAFRIGDNAYPDPYSRFQPEGPHAASMAVDAQAYRWSDAGWRGRELREQIFYELHVGAFTEGGTFDAAIEKLEWLRKLGITTIEVMPVAEFPGRFNWGYDGVGLFAPYRGYGDYDAFKRFVDAAHGVGLGVILDVVYNHGGPAGNYLEKFSAHYFCKHGKNEWGTPYNVDGDHSQRVRQFILDNACYWVREFHLDGLRLDATSAITDRSESHILAELVAATRAAAQPRPILLIAEDEQQQASRLLPQHQGGFGLDAMWNDDFHHAALVALTGQRHAYYHDYTGRAQEFVASAKRGFLFQGQFYHWQRQRRGERLRAPVHRCVTFLENHDQVANSLRGERPLAFASKAKYRALLSVLLLGPQTPLLFMGQEFGASAPFMFFADHDAPLNADVRKGRAEFLSQFPGVATPQGLAALTDPSAEDTFLRCKLRWDEAPDAPLLQLHRDLIALRREDAVLRAQRDEYFDAAVLSEQAFLLRWFDTEHGDRLLVVNLGAELALEPCAEPLLAPSRECYWSLLWSSERLVYGGAGVVLPEVDSGWRLPGECATLLREHSVLSAREFSPHWA